MELIGRTIGQYQIVEAIGRGGMASVFKAYQPALERFVALKILMPQQATPEFSERFTREAKAIAQLNHPNILPVIDFGQDRDVTYIVMKYVPGGTLTDRLKKPIDLATTARLINQIAAALDHAHRRSIVHRDVKPSNVLLDEGEWVQLTDFGLAKILGGDQSLTSSGFSMGTPAYLSPEQGQGLSPDHRTDIYSLGVMLFEMTTGRLPFTAETPMGVVIKHIYDTPPSPRSINPALTEAIETVILQALAKSIEQRFDSAGELAAAFQQAVSQSPAIEVLATKITDPQATPKVDEARTPTPARPRSEAEGVAISRKLLMEETVPIVPHFVGREAELAAYRSRLERDRFVIVTGMAGMGKTTLGAKLAREVAERPDNIFWFTFDQVEKSTADALYWALASFLDSRGESSLWRYLQGEIGAQKPLERMAKLNLLVAALATGNHVLCFDDFQIAAHAPDIAYIFKIIRQRFVDLHQDFPARIIIMGREVSSDMEYLVADTLHGLSEDEAAAFIADRHVTLARGLVKKLWGRAEGNPKLLELSVSALSSMRAGAQETFIANLARKGDIRDYVMTNIYAALEPEEQLIMGALSVFPGSVERDGAEEILAEEGVSAIARRIDTLINKHVIGEAEDDRIHLHSLVRDYCYHVLNRRDRDRFHQRAAEYYEQAHNWLSAAYHHFERKLYAHALDLLAANSQAIINAGGVSTLIEQLGRFELRELTLAQRIALSKLRGEAHRIKGEYQPALAAYEAGLGETLTDVSKADMLRLMGGVHLKLENYEKARDYVQQGLVLSQAAQNQTGIAESHHDLGWAYYRLGQLEPARQHFTLSRQMAGELNNRLLHGAVGLGLGLIAWKEDRLAEALAHFEDSRRIFREYHDRVRESSAMTNLAVVYRKTGDTARCLSYYMQSMTIDEETGDVYGLSVVLNNLGDVSYANGDYDEAIRYYSRLAQLAESIGHAATLSLAHAGLADSYLAQGNPQRALEAAHIANTEALEAGTTLEIGVSYRVLGDVLLTLGEISPAKAFYEQGLPLLRQVNEEEDLKRAQRGLEQAIARINTASPTSPPGGQS
jgi:serine/threonine protein kinase/tetratricopeptide (TPR) repeat protein